MKPLYVYLKCHTQNNVYSHLDMYTSDVSRFKYRVNQPRMYITNRHINTYRVYGSIISTNIHKTGRCTFFGYNSILFLASILALSDACHLWSIYTTSIAECTFSPIGIFVGLAQQSKWNVSESYQLIQTCAQIKLQTKKQKNNYYMISKTNGLIDYMNRQHKGYSTMERTFHLWFTK